MASIAEEDFGESFGQKRPPLYEMIKTILHEYPSGQIFKEIIQNADDARATEVKFFLDDRSLQTLPPSPFVTTSDKDRFKSPALLSFNNAPFKQEDWASIQSLYLSGKARNPHKVGKFGIGFNSVYNITDLPVILSEEYCGFLEPQEQVWKNEPGKRYKLKSLKEKCPVVLDQFNGICDFSKLVPHFKGGTLFRFPLRKKSSKLSKEVYNVSKLCILLELLKQEAQYLLVFLRSVCSIEITQINRNGKFIPIFKVSIDQEEGMLVAQQRQKLMRSVETTYSDGNVISDVCHFKISLTTNGIVTGQNEWLVINQIGSDNGDVLQLSEKQHVLPWVGTAIEINSFQESEGRIFCVLPLPVEDRVPFCVHVNGTFAVSSNRRSLKWEAQERKDDEEGIWNKLLVSKCVPSCYVRLVSELMKLNKARALVYSCWPDIQKVCVTPWSGILEPFYTLLLHSNNVVHTPLKDGQWINVNDGIFTKEVPQAVNEALLQCNVSLVEVDYNCTNAIDKYYDGNVTELKPFITRFHLKQNSGSYNSMSRENKIIILKYCLSDRAYNDIIGLWLLPLANQTFQQFEQKTWFNMSQLYLCSRDNPFSLLPGLEHKLVNVYDDDSLLQSQLTLVANSGCTQLTVLGVTHIANLLSQCATSTWSDEQMEHFWQWMNKHQLSHFQNQPILPVELPSGHSNIVSLIRQDGVVYIPPYHHSLSTELVTGFQKCGIKFADARKFTYLTHFQLEQYVYQFEQQDMLDAMSNLASANIKFTSQEADSIQDFFSSRHIIFTTPRLATISSLSLFCSLQGNGSSVRYSINSMKSKYCWNKAFAMKGSYKFRIDLIPAIPLVINTDQSNLNLLTKLNGNNCIEFLTEIDYLCKIAFPCIKNKQIPIGNVVPLMQSVLDHFHSYKSIYTQFDVELKSLPFIEVLLNAPLEAPCNLFDPDEEFLKVLFLGKNKFPETQFHKYLPILKQCGLRTVATASELFDIVIFTSTTCKKKYLSNIAITDNISFVKMQTFLKYLSLRSGTLHEIVHQSTLLNALINHDHKGNFFWLPISCSPPQSYPSCLLWKGSKYPSGLASTKCIPIVPLSQGINSSSLPMIVGSQVVFVEYIPKELSSYICSSASDLIKAVVAHFQLVIEKKFEISNSLLQNISIQTYGYLSKNIHNCDTYTFKGKWIWMEKLLKFLDTSQIAIENNPSFATNLEPYVYTLPFSLHKFEELFKKCGVKLQVSSSQIISVLQSIKDADSHSHFDKISANGAWSLVRAILDWVVEDKSRLSQSNLLVPVESEFTNWPKLFPLSEVSYTDNDMLREIAKASDDEEYHLVHPKVAYLSSKLGLTPLSDRLDITEDVFEDAGQHEPLVTRLSNILREYKDGLTIIKEMIQNADDARATEVNILYDNRNHPIENLFFKGMADSHGPALIVHNNSTFTDEDFENITKLAGATKANKPLKIGKFGIGFCSVYHITDVPSFVSGEWLYIFDPTLKYLKGVVRNESRPGKRVKYQSKFFAKSKQLVPYENLFGFKSSSAYAGTMFRLPFRTSTSQISSTLYNDQMILSIQEELKNNASKLLLFLQSVKKITFSCINGKKQVKKLSIECSRNGNMNKCVINSFTEYWLVSFFQTSLMNKPATSSVACQLMKKKRVFQCQASLEGGVFCFLPLAVPSTGLPVHVSANFAVMSNRSGIWTGSSEIASGSRDLELWNQQLMETVIPKAYCNLLMNLKEMVSSGEVEAYDFYSLWPLEVNLKMRHPWEKLISSLYNFISKECLFYSVSTSQWLTIAQTQFLPSSLFQISTETLSEAVAKLQLQVISLPCQHLKQIQRSLVNSTISVITEYQFAEKFLLNSHLLNESTETRNKVLFGIHSTVSIQFSSSLEAVQSDANLLSNLLRKHPCVPCSPKGCKLDLANNLIDPVMFKDIFEPDDGKFPVEEGFYNNNLIRQSLINLGLMSSNVSWNVIIDSALTVKSLFSINKIKALTRISALMKCMKGQKSCPPPKLINIPFLPVLKKPAGYILPWKGENHDLYPPSQVIAPLKDDDIERLTAIVGSQQVIVNTCHVRNEGCGKIHHNVSDLVGISNDPSLYDVLNHFQCLTDHCQTASYNNHTSLDHIANICRNIYKYLNNQLERSTSHAHTVYEQIASFCDKNIIWTGKSFEASNNFARNWKINGPYLYKLPDMLSEQTSLLKVLKICDGFDVNKLLNTLLLMYDSYEKLKALPKHCHKFIDNLISELNDASGRIMNDEEIILVDTSYVLRPTSDLAYNDAQWLSVSEDCNLVHKKLSRERALEFGVKTIRNKCLDEYVSHSAFAGTEFGQREELTQRIKNILRDYPLDVTFLKELLQNADDAKATKMCVILDKRTHGTEKLPSKEWAQLQGPAVLVWNDKEFSDKDLEGIQKLGLGSKRDDYESIGQFGIGFNVVYHLTDCPSFITCQGKILCVFDPHCQYIPGASKLNPGRQYNKLDKEFWENFKDLHSCYLQDAIQDQPKYLCDGSLFRFPLRSNEDLVKASELLNNDDVVLTSGMMDKKLTEWVDKVEEALLFLNNITQFEFYVIENERFQFRASYRVNMNQHAVQSLKDFQAHLAEYKISHVPKLVTYSLTLYSAKYTNSRASITSTRRSRYSQISNQLEWVVQQGVGNISVPEQKWKYLDKVLPKHGIAAPLKDPGQFSGKIFCFLPLSVSSKLPVHINGQFVLSSNRLSLWVSGDDENSDKDKWNKQLIEAISSSYVHFLMKVRSYVVKENGYTKYKDFDNSTARYYKLFPYCISDTEKETFRLHADWFTLAKLVFQSLKENNMPILATEILEQNLVKVKWCVLFECNNPFSQTYFMPEQTDIITILKKIGITLTCAPIILYKHLKECAFIATPATVFDFYSKFHTIILKNTCPLPVVSTPFQTQDNFVNFIRYLLLPQDNSVFYVFPKSPKEIPLLLTADCYIIQFKKNLFSSKFADVFPESSHCFLHQQMIALKMSPSYFIQIKDIKFELVNKIFVDNFPSELNNLEVNNQSWHLITELRLKQLWKCISLDTIFLHHQSSILEKWALLPSTNYCLYRSNSPTLPICSKSHSDSTLLLAFKLLCGKLDIPELNDKIHERTQVYCPTIEDYEEVTHIIYNKHKQHHIFSKAKLERNDIEILLDYFSKTTFRHDNTVKNQIKSLPIYQTMHGKLTSLLGKSVYLWPSLNFCIAGYEKWGLLENVVFLERAGSWRKLCGSDFSLLGEDPDEKHIYCQLIFPSFNKLTPEERMEHLEYIRDFLFDDAQYYAARNDARVPHTIVARTFLANISNLKCLPYKGKLLTISSFCDHTVEIFTTFYEFFCFLSEEYRDETWLKFFRKLNLQTSVQFDQFLTLANKVSMGSHNDLGKASDVLLSYLFSSKSMNWHSNQYFMHQIGNVSFVRVATLDSYSWIKAPCSPLNCFPTIGLTKLNEAVIFDCASLVWTVKPVVKLPKIPSSMSVEKLGVCTSPSASIVFDNIINISRTGLADFNLFHTYNPQYLQLEKHANLVNIIIENVKYLKHYNAELLTRLSDTPCIPVPAESPLSKHTCITKPVLVKPFQVVLILDEMDAIDFTPFIHQAPKCLYPILESLEQIGVSQKIDFKHINFLLQMLQSLYLDGIISVPNEVIVIRKAINKLKLLLQSTNFGKKEIKSQLKELCLPTQIEDMKWKLVSSKKLVFSDTLRFNLQHFNFTSSAYSLFKIPPDNERKHLTKRTLEKEFCLQLPKEVRPIGLSLCSIERVLVHNKVEKSPLSSHFKKLIGLLPSLGKAMASMIQGFNFKESEVQTFIKAILNILNKMKVVTISDLRVQVELMNDNHRKIGTSKVDYSLQNDNNCQYIMYVNEEATPSSSLWNDVAQSLCIEVSHETPLKFFRCRETLSKLLAIQKQEELGNLTNEVLVQESNNEDSSSNLIPRIGKSLPPQLVAMLSQDINHIYRPEEYVGYTIEEDEYIWAIVLYPIPIEVGSKENQLNRYAIAYSENETEPHVVSAIDLYKFTRKRIMKESEESAIVLSQSTTASTFLHDVKTSQELLALKKNICEELKLISNSDLTESERKRAIRRMYLHYHPDKATNHSELYEETFKYLLRQIDRLKNGLPLEEPKDERKEVHVDLHVSPFEPSKWQELFEDWNHALNRPVYSCYTRSEFQQKGGVGGSIEINEVLRNVFTSPDQQEADRWMRQAQSDLEAMKILCNNVRFKPVSCQVIFMAHEVAEKSLKAGMYALIGINPNSESLKSHNLTSHAHAISSQKPGQLVELPQLTASMENFYLDTRFPNRHPKPKAPVDIYHPDQAEKAADIAKKLFDLIQCVNKGQL